MQTRFYHISTADAGQPALHGAIRRAGFANSSALFARIAEDFPGARDYYPGFSGWLSRVEAELQDGKRRLIVSKTKERLSGISILKVSNTENKLCTFWIAPEFRRQGLATELMKCSLQEFNGAIPTISIANDTRWAFIPMMQKFHFEKTNIKKGLYQPGISEHFYQINGEIASLSVLNIFSYQIQPILCGNFTE